MISQALELFLICSNNTPAVLLRPSIRRSVSRSVLQSLVLSLVLSRPDYGNLTLAGVSSHLLSRLQTVMNAATRLIFSSSRFQNITPLLLQLRWLKAPERTTFKQSVLVYKCLQGSASAYLTDELCQVTDVEARQFIFIIDCQPHPTPYRLPSGPGLKLTCLTFPTPVIVQCLRSDSSCFGHYNHSCLLTYLLWSLDQSLLPSPWLR